MRLQGAVFGLDGTLLDGGAPRPGLLKFLSLLKMEGVWMYLVAAPDQAGALDAPEAAALKGYFRGRVDAGPEVGLTAPEPYEKAVRRLRTPKETVVVFTCDPAVLRALKGAGFRVAFVSPAPGEEERALADYCIRDYGEMTRQG